MKEILTKVIDYSGSGIELVRHFQDKSNVFFLDSSMAGTDDGRYSFIGFDPFDVVRLKGISSLDPIKKKYIPFNNDLSTDLTPFPSGIAGFLSYDFGLYQEGICVPKESDHGVPDVLFGFYDCILTIDHVAKKLIITSSGYPETNERGRSLRAQKRLDEILAAISQISLLTECPAPSVLPVDMISSDLVFQPDFSRSEYIAAVKKALQYIAQGDIYQVNLAQRFSLPFENGLTKALSIYEDLRNLSPSHFGGYFDGGNFKILSSSPERFLSLRDGWAQTQPMKGTRPRGNDPQSDEMYRQSLVKSPKEIAELLMVTDLLRNDLGKVCEFGSIDVAQLRAIESYSTVFQATSKVRGKLKKENDGFDLLAACFPGGSITGCPKIRSMQVIDELEPVKRSVYTGALGYIGFNGNMDFNILIRTLVANESAISFYVGAGIVADSDPQAEYQETLLKAVAMHNAVLVALLRVYQRI